MRCKYCETVVIESIIRKDMWVCPNALCWESIGLLDFTELLK